MQSAMVEQFRFLNDFIRKECLQAAVTTAFAKVTDDELVRLSILVSLLTLFNNTPSRRERGCS
jgi:AMMECR1 domain-containing protein